MNDTQPKPTAAEQIPSAKIAPTPRLITELPYAVCPTCGTKSSNEVTHQEMDTIEQKHPPQPKPTSEPYIGLGHDGTDLPNPNPTTEWTVIDVENLLEQGGRKAVRDAINAELAAERELHERRKKELDGTVRNLEATIEQNAILNQEIQQLREQLAATERKYLDMERRHRESERTIRELVEALNEAKDVIYQVFHADKIDSRIRQWCGTALRKLQTALSKLSTYPLPDGRTK